MSLLAELKRRNVIRVGIAYALAGWVLLQAGDFALDLVGAPDWVIQALAVVVLLGLPVALGFAWAFEMTPEGIRREHEVDRSQSVTAQTGRKLDRLIIGVLVLAVTFLLADKFWLQGEKGSGSNLPDGVAGEEGTAGDLTLTPAVPEAADTRPSIAVLPFENRSRSEDDAYFVAGIHDDLLTNLARIGGLKVISRTSVGQYRDTPKTIPQIAAELGVATVMEGAVQRVGDTVRINVQLIDAESDEHLWAEIYDRDLTAQNLFAIQSEISRAIADALKATLSPTEIERISELPTDDLAAWDAYQRGRQLMTHRRPGELQQALESFRQAVDRDPGFALAWVGVADAANLVAEYGSMRREDAIPVIENAFEHAIAIDPELGEAYASIANVHEFHGQYDEMEAAFRKAIELSPNYATAYHWYSNSLANVYPLRTQEQLDLARKAVELDPRAPIIVNNLANAYGNRGLYTLAEQQFRKTLELAPELTVAHYALAGMYGFEQGRFDLAIQESQAAARKDPTAPNNVFEAMYWLQLGEFGRAEALRQRLAQEHPEDWRTLLIEQFSNLNQGNRDGLREIAGVLQRQSKPDPWMMQAAALGEAIFGDPARAMAIWERADPGWRQPEQWQRLVRQWPSQACPVAWTLGQVGETRLGGELLRDALEVHATVLPQATEHPDNWGTGLCLLVAGDNEGALAEFERQVSHNHLNGLSVLHRWSLYDAIRHEPRYQAAWNTYQERIAEQRVTMGLEPEAAL